MRVAVIGAGAAGLTACKAMLEVGLDPECFEASGHIGGLWAYDDAEPDAGPSYRSLRTNTSKAVTAFSDFPFPEAVPDFPSREIVDEYLRAYANAFDLLPHIRFGCVVREVRPAGRSWRLIVSNGVHDAEREYDAVVVSTGVFRRRFMPLVAGIESFPGDVLHSIDYGEPERCAGRDVLVVGLGSSAADIATDLAGTSASVTLSVRRGAWVAPRIVNGRPLDHRNTRLANLLSPKLRVARRRRLLIAECARRGMQTPQEVWERHGVPFRPDAAPSVTSDQLLPLIADGLILPRPGIAGVDGPEVRFVDSSTTRPNAIIFCTGYSMNFPFLPWLSTPWSDAQSGLYRLVFPPELPGLAFVGVCRAQGPILPIVEMQARWVARVFSGEARLPSPAVMRSEIESRWHAQTNRGDSPFRVRLLPYLDEVGDEIGVRPRLLRHPGLLGPLLAGPPVAAQYRLDGPGRWAGAEAVLLQEM